MRIGIGYDVHKLVEGRKLIIGGVTIPHEKGLLGHSDADVLLHAIGDALLGAAGLGDLGEHFPDSDPQYKGIDSMKLLAEVGKKIVSKKFKISNIDAVVIAEAPKLAPHREQMKMNIAEALKIPVDAVNVKATTEEGLGFTGKKEGIAAWAAVTITEVIPAKAGIQIIT
ncbi:MAG: 2-C-methyl-D-erythritol 2,4-cyclodiphosphate synthase [Deltaproteobacteria bacterium]|nr:2-C-methyl-D-erythritol 2,4-cyclodiphosphate synthase [Deltaproteobacteria bacterium]